MTYRYRSPGRERALRLRRGRRVRGPPGPAAGAAGREQRHDGRGVAAVRAAGRAVPRWLLPEQRAVPVRPGHRAADGRGAGRPGVRAVRVARRRPVVLPVPEHHGRGPDWPLGRLRGRVPGRRRGRHAGRTRAAADGHWRARRDARACRVRLRALFVLRSRDDGHQAAGRRAHDHVHGRRARPTGQRIGRTARRRGASVHRQAHGRQAVRLTSVTWYRPPVLPIDKAVSRPLPAERITRQPTSAEKNLIQKITKLLHVFFFLQAQQKHPFFSGFYVKFIMIILIIILSNESDDID